MGPFRPQRSMGVFIRIQQPGRPDPFLEKRDNIAAHRSRTVPDHRAQRQLRDHFSALAEEVSVSLQTSVLAAQAAVKTTTTERESRIRDLKAELARVEGLAERARALGREPVAVGA